MQRISSTHAQILGEGVGCLLSMGATIPRQFESVLLRQVKPCELNFQCVSSGRRPVLAIDMLPRRISSTAATSSSPAPA